jgi:hypothetical protein
MGDYFVDCEGRCQHEDELTRGPRVIVGHTSIGPCCQGTVIVGHTSIGPCCQIGINIDIDIDINIANWYLLSILMPIIVNININIDGTAVLSTERAVRLRAVATVVETCGRAAFSSAMAAAPGAPAAPSSTATAPPNLFANPGWRGRGWDGQ